MHTNRGGTPPEPPAADAKSLPTLVDVKLRPPVLQPGTVHRPRLVDRLREATNARVVAVVAPAGYGKTTLLAQWLEQEGRPVAWLSVDRADNDPVTLLTSVVTALRGAGLIGSDPLENTRLNAQSVISRGVARVGRELASHGRRGLLMLDHLESLSSRIANDVVAELVAWAPETVQIVVSSRRQVRLPIPVMRAQGALFEMSASDLAMNEPEARALLTESGLDVGEGLDELMARTEGWPVGLYLVALAVQSGASLQSALQVGGDDRFLADYLRHEVLSHLSKSAVSFLTRTSILDSVCGPLCDAVLDTKGSGSVLESLDRSNLLIVPLDRTRTWYRYHHLLRDLLRSELLRREPVVAPVLHARAAAWYEASDMLEAAIHHAQEADESERVARLVGAVARTTYALGRAETVNKWLDWFEQTGRIDHDPTLAAIGALSYAIAGEARSAELWATAVLGDEQEASLGQDASAPSLILKALRGRSGVARMRTDAAAARDGAPPDSEWYAAALGSEGLGALWDGDPEHADSLLARSAIAAERSAAHPTATLVLACRALIALDSGDLPTADELSARSVAVVREHGLERYATSGLPFIIAARCALRLGDIPEARRLVAQASTIRPFLTTALPGIAVQTLVELTRAYIELADIAGARKVLRDAGDILFECPDLGHLAVQCEELKNRLRSLPAGSVGPSILTTAELRLLPLLVTHLSFPEIADRLYVSRHTIKTQAMSIYRKLGASSRSQAVDRARESGLLPP